MTQQFETLAKMFAAAERNRCATNSDRDFVLKEAAKLSEKKS
jgi:hypothetical protein